LNLTDLHFVQSVGVRLDKFKRISAGTYHFRCPFCGDSQFSTAKKRGYFYDYQGSAMFKCHNCSLSLNLGSFLKRFDSTMYSEYIMERLSENKKRKEPSQKELSALKSIPLLDKYPRLSVMQSNHPARVYVRDRKIPPKYHGFLRYTESFVDEDGIQWDNDPRIIIPFLSRAGELLGLQGRTIGNSGLRYITRKYGEPCLYGLDRIKTDKTIYITEGPIDSMFLDNCIATAGAGKKRIEEGSNVVVYPSNFSCKDINDMVLDESIDFFQEKVLTHNVYSGNMAMLKLRTWAKC